MNKNIDFDLIILILVIFLLVLFSAIRNGTLSNLDSISSLNKDIVAIKEYSNYAWKMTRNGYAIFNDGTIYNYSMDDMEDVVSDYYKLDTKKGLYDFVLKTGTKNKTKLSDEDLNILIDTIDKLDKDDSDFDLSCRGADMGSTIYSVYKNNTEIVLKQSGDCNGYNKSTNSRRILSIMDKYMKGL